MNPHTETEIRKSFINCSKGAAQRIAVPRSVLDADWEPMVFLGWIDPKSPQTGYVVVETPAGLRGLVLRKNPPAGRGAAQMCQLCKTLHAGSGVALVSIQRSKSAKDRYNSMATYVCSDLRCSEYTLGLRKPAGVRQMEETLSVGQRAERTLANVRSLVQRVESGSGARPR